MRTKGPDFILGDDGRPVEVLGTVSVVGGVIHITKMFNADGQDTYLLEDAVLFMGQMEGGARSGEWVTWQPLLTLAPPDEDTKIH